MANNPATSEFTSFTLDNMGRFLCNTAHEADSPEALFSSIVRGN
jgi:hypothetical protein